MKIRDATAEDLPDIVEIYNSNVHTRVSTADTEPVSIEDRTAWFREHDPSRRPLWVTEDAEGIAGWISVGDFYDGRPAYHATAEVGVYVRQDRRGGGLGRRLVAEAVRRAPGLGLKTLTAGIFAHNGPSVALFEGFGFETWARFPNVADLDGVERDLLVLGLRVDDQTKGGA